jgi:hypothetical protein
MSMLDDLICQTKKILESLQDVKSELESSLVRETKRRNGRTQRPAPSLSSTKLTIDARVRTCQEFLCNIISNANILLERLPSELVVAAQIQPTTTLSNTQERADLNDTENYNDTQTRSTQVQSERPAMRSVSTTRSLSDSELVAEVIASIEATIDRSEEEGDDKAEKEQGVDIEEEGRRSRFRGAGGVVLGDTAAVGRDNGSNEAPSAHRGIEGKEVATFTMSQMQKHMVAEIEALAAAKPERCYDKILLLDFTPPDFTQAKRPARGYMQGTKFTKINNKLIAQTASAEFSFPPISALTQRYERPSVKEMNSFFQRVFDNPPDDPLSYFAGPPPMPSHYTPFVDAGPRLRRRNAGNIPGVNTPYWYISQCEMTPATLHIEDGGLGSVNLVLAGAPKIWLIIPEYEKDRLEHQVKQLYGPRRFECSQQIRHYDSLISPSLLEEWGITYYLDCCLPGEMIVTRQNTYHQVLNMGQNVAESVNIEFSNTPDLPLSYVWCTRPTCGAHSLTASHFSLHPSATTSNTKRRRQSSSISNNKKSRIVARSLLATTCASGDCSRHSQIRDKFAKYSRRTLPVDDVTIELLTRLFFAIGSPEAWCQLQQACRLARAGTNSHLFCRGETPAKVMEALDKVDGVVSSCSIVHRHHLASLSNRRRSLVHQQKALGSKQRTRNGRVQRAETLAIDELYQEVFALSVGEQHLQPCAQWRTKLENRLRRGRNWSSLQARFSVGTLALVATSPDLTNAQFVWPSLSSTLY